MAFLLFLSSEAASGTVLYDILLCCALLCLCVTCFVIFINRHNEASYAFSIFQGGFLYWYIIPMVAAAWRQEVTLTDGTHFTDAAEIATAAAAVFVSKLALDVAYAAVPHGGGKRQLLAEPSTAGIIPGTWMIGLQFAAGLVPLLLVKDPLLQLLAGRSGDLFRRPNKGSSETVIFLLFYFLLSASLLSLYVLLADRRRGRQMIYRGIFLLSTGISVLAGGARTILLLLVMPGLTLYATMKRGNPRAKALLVLGTLSLYLFANVLVSYREQGFGAYRSQSTLGDRNFTDSDFFGELIFSRRIIPAERDFSYESPLLYIPIGLIPRVLWPNKPDPVNSDYVMRLRMGQPSGDLVGNVLPGLIGQYWQVSGWLGVVACGVWLGLAAAVLGHKLLNGSFHTRYCVMVAVWGIFISFRNLAAGNFVPLVLCFLTFRLAAHLREYTPFETVRVAPRGRRLTEGPSI